MESPNFLRFCGRVAELCLHHPCMVLRWFAREDFPPVSPFCELEHHASGLAVDIVPLSESVRNDIWREAHNLGLTVTVRDMFLHVAQPPRKPEDRGTLEMIAAQRAAARKRSA